MTLYAAYPSYDVALVDLVTVTPQCTSDGLKYARRTYAASGEVNDEGAYLELVFSILQDTTEYTDLLTQFGILSSNSHAVTIYARGQTYGFTRYNGTALRPLLGQEAKWSYFPRDVVILIKNLTQLVEP